MHSLPLFHRIAGERVVVVGVGEMAAAKRRLIERAGGICVGDDQAADCRLAFVAVEHGAGAIAALLKARGLLVNVADRPDLCDFTLPSVLERGDVLVAVGTGGASAGLAKQLRLRLEAFLPASLGELARALSEARGRLRERWPDGGSRRAAIDAALADGGPLDLLAAESATNVETWLDEPATMAPPATVTINLRSMDPDDLTLREARILGTADTILHDPDVAPAVLARARADAARMPIPSGQFPPAGQVTIRLRSPITRSSGAWFRYTRRAGRFTAIPLNPAGWIALVAVIALSTLAGIAAMRWAMSWTPLAGFIVLPLVLLVTFAVIYRVVKATGSEAE